MEADGEQLGMPQDDSSSNTQVHIADEELQRCAAPLRARVHACDLVCPRLAGAGGSPRVDWRSGKSLRADNGRGRETDWCGHGPGGGDRVALVAKRPCCCCCRPFPMPHDEKNGSQKSGLEPLRWAMEAIRPDVTTPSAWAAEEACSTAGRISIATLGE